MSTADEMPVVLLVSGSDFLNKSIKRLSKDSFAVLTAADVDNACELLAQKNDVCIVLSELALATDKNALIHRIRTSRQSSVAGLPVLVLAGESDQEHLLETALTAGANDYIHLPLASIELDRRIRMHTGKFLESFTNPAHALEDNLSQTSTNGFLQKGYFLSRLKEEIEFSKQHQLYIGSALLKIDDAEKVSSINGKNISKAIINAFIITIGKQIRGEDTFTYLGDYTFGILYPVTNGLSTQVAIKRILTKIKTANFQFEGKKITVTASAALFSTRPTQSTTADQVMKTLQSRLKQTEGLGGNKIANSRAESDMEAVSLEKGLKYIRTQQGEKISRQLPHLLESVYPLLAFARKKNKDALDKILSKLQS